jgi:hypothetical protein
MYFYKNKLFYCQSRSFLIFLHLNSQLRPRNPGNWVIISEIKKFYRIILLKKQNALLDNMLLSGKYCLITDFPQ